MGIAGLDEARRLRGVIVFGSTKDASDSQEETEGEEADTGSVSLIEQDVPPH
jgi:hypothetical protein